MTAPESDRRFSGLSVLVVEDDSIIYYLMESMLNELGCDAVRRAASVDVALSLVDNERPDVAILDVNLAGKTSYAVAGRLDDLGVPIVFSTGYGRVGILDTWRAKPVIEKPFTLGQFADSLAAALGKLPAG